MNKNTDDVNSRKHHDISNDKSNVHPSSEISTSRKHSMDYFTVDGVVLRTGYADKKYWYLVPLREGIDNGIDFLWKYYRGADDASVDVDIKMDDDLFRIKIRNSNYKDISVFQDLKALFDFDMRYGSKQDVHIISRGMLGDAMKQSLSLGYVLLHANDDGTKFEDRQWEHPFIIRHNGKECMIYLNVDKANQDWNITLEVGEELIHTDTEIEVALPIIDEVREVLAKSIHYSPQISHLSFLSFRHHK